MPDDYFVIDIETCPINLENYFNLDEEGKMKLLNPIDSRIVAIGVRYMGENKILMEGDERKILEDFWTEWKRIKELNPNTLVVGFNINNFDMPFITTRSFIHNVKIVPFMVKLIIDVRERINAFRFGKSRGKLSDFASVMGLKEMDMDGSGVAKLCVDGNYEKLREYLINDIEVTDALFLRARETNILDIKKW